jgi:hypothetical protein
MEMVSAELKIESKGNFPRIPRAFESFGALCKHSLNFESFS